MNIPTLSKNPDPALRKLDRAVELFITIMFACVILLTCCSCGSTKHITQLVRDVRVDTVYLSNVQYDSIYIYQDKYVDRVNDTIYIKDKSVEYRYKLLRDTVRRVRVDSVPVIREIEVVKEVKYIPWYAKALSALGLMTIAVLLLRLFR